MQVCSAYFIVFFLGGSSGPSLQSRVSPGPSPVSTPNRGYPAMNSFIGQPVDVKERLDNEELRPCCVSHQYTNSSLAMSPCRAGGSWLGFAEGLILRVQVI